MQLKKEKFAQDNALIRATHQMNNMELKLFYLACTVREQGETYIEISLSDIKKKLNIGHGGNQNKLIYDSLLNLVKSSVIRNIINNEHIAEPIITGRISENNNLVKIKFNELYLPYLDELDRTNQFTWIYLKQITKLNLTYSPRIYAFCKMLLGANLKVISYKWWLKDMRQYLNVENKYNKFKDFNNRIIKPSIDEINAKNDDVSIRYEHIKKGRSVVGIYLTIYKSKFLPSNNNDTEKITINYPEEVKNFKWWEYN